MVELIVEHYLKQYKIINFLKLFENLDEKKLNVLLIKIKTKLKKLLIKLKIYIKLKKKTKLYIYFH